MAQVNAIAIVAQIVNVANFVTGMVGFGRTAVGLVLQQVQGYGDIFLSGYGVGRKLDKVFIELIIFIKRTISPEVSISDF